MPSEVKPRGKSRAGSSPEQVASLPPWLLSRSLCCIGYLLLMQNLTLLRWAPDLTLPCNGPMLPYSVPPAAAVLDAQSIVPGPEQSAQTPSAQPVPTVAEPTALLVSPDIPAVTTTSSSVTQTSAGERDGVPENTLGAASHPGQLLPTITIDIVSEAEGLRMHNEGGKGSGPKRLKSTDSLFKVPRDSLRLFGRKVPDSVLLTIGFGTVTRKKEYVFETIGVMLGLNTQPGKKETISAKERSMVVTVGHFADFNLAWVKSISERLQHEYQDLVKQGHFHGIHAPEELYPRLDFCPPLCSYKDDPTRVRWRSKQNIDYAFLMYYSAPLAPYYLQIEDDINFAQNWVARIVNYIGDRFPSDFLSPQQAPWRLLDFSQLGFIGKAFQSNELTRMAQYLLLFYDQMPCDLLLGDWMQSMTQMRRVDYWRSNPSLFQHVGMFRSLGGFQPLQERAFGKLVFNNPKASIVWNFTEVPTYEGKFAYIPGGEMPSRNDVCDFKASKAHKGKIKRCWFWAKTPITAGQHLTLVFEKPIQLKGVFVEFGNHIHTTDLPENGVIQVADNARPNIPVVVPMGTGTADLCGKFFRILEVQKQTMVYWEEKVSTPAVLPMPQVRCLRIAADKPQAAWTLVYNILIKGE